MDFGTVISSIIVFAKLLLANLVLPIVIVIYLDKILAFLRVSKYVDLNTTRIIRGLLIVYALIFGVFRPLLALITGRF